MSGIAGMFSRDGSPALSEVVSRMAEAIAFRGPDAGKEWLNGSIGLAHRLLITTPEAADERQPITDPSGSLAAVFDGRLDNRAELQEQIRRSRLELRDDTDPEMLLRGYQLWGDELPGKLLGDFVFAIWDRTQRKLFCARDPIGAKPFYFYLDEKRFLFASELIAIVRSATVDLHPDEAFIAEILRDTVYGHTRTLFAGIQRLPGAHSLVVTPSTMRMSRYWSPEALPAVRYPSSNDYAEHARELLENAIKARLRARGKISCDLSGGLDSSTIAVIAQQLRRTGRVQSDLFASSMVFGDMECDESQYIDAVVRHSGILSYKTEWGCDAPQAPDWAQDVKETAELPTHPTIWKPIFQNISAHGARVSLLGTGGDEWFGGETESYADMLANLQWARLVCCLRNRRRVGTVGWDTLARDLVRPLIPRKILTTIRGHRNTRIDPSPVERRLLAKADPTSQVLAHSRFRLSGRAPRAMAAIGFDGHPARAMELVQLTQARFGVESRFPFHDRRVIEFCLSIPGDEHLVDGRWKAVLRNAANDLPEVVRNRSTKAEFSSNIVKRLNDWRTLFCNMRTVERGWVSRGVVEAMCVRVRGGATYPDFYREASALWSVIAVEAWDRTMLLT